MVTITSLMFTTVRGIEADYQARREEIAEGAGLKDERLAAENLAFREDLAKLRASEKEANIRASGLFEEMVAAGKAAQLEKIALQKAHSEELNQAVAEAVSIVAESGEEKHRLTRQELLKFQKGDREEFKLLEESFMAEKERLVEELARRDKYTEAADLKIQEMELDILKYRQNASGELLKQIAEQDERFREVVRDEKNRRVAREMGFEQELSRARAVFEARVKQLEDLLSAKEKLMDDGDRFYRQKLEQRSLQARKTLEDIASRKNEVEDSLRSFERQKQNFVENNPRTGLGGVLANQQ